MRVRWLWGRYNLHKQKWKICLRIHHLQIMSYWNPFQDFHRFLYVGGDGFYSVLLFVLAPWHPPHRACPARTACASSSSRHHLGLKNAMLCRRGPKKNNGQILKKFGSWRVRISPIYIHLSFLAASQVCQSPRLPNRPKPSSGHKFAILKPSCRSCQNIVARVGTHFFIFILRIWSRFVHQ